jgi:hypothetical protein
MSVATTATMPKITDGALVAYYIFDVADTIDLDQIAKMQAVHAERAQLRMRAVTAPSYIAFPVPPLMIPLPDMQVLGHVANARVKVYDYGVVSLRLAIPFSGDWDDFSALASKLRFSEEVPASAKKVFDAFRDEIKDAFRKPHTKALLEDYYTFIVRSFGSDVRAAELLSERAEKVAALVRGEDKKLSSQEIEEALRVHLSYFDNDLCLLEWDAAFIYDRGEAAETIESILEFANTQLVELRTYDATLNAELDWIYASDNSKARGPFGHRAAAHRAERLRLMLVDIGELMDRTNNALKIIGDAFYARVYRSIRSRLGLGDWEKQIDAKLESVGNIYRFHIDEAATARGEALEWIIILLILFEVVWGLIRH